MPNPAVQPGSVQSARYLRLTDGAPLSILSRLAHEERNDGGETAGQSRVYYGSEPGTGRRGGAVAVSSLMRVPMMPNMLAVAEYPPLADR